MESAGPKSAKYINALLIAATGISILFGIFSFLGYFLVRRNNHKQAGLDSADEEPELPPAVQGLDSADEEPELPPAVQGLDSADEEPELPPAVQGLDSADEEPELPPAVQGLDSADEEPELPPAVQRLDSADEEPELPPAVQDLIRKLDNKTEPLRWLPTLAYPQFQDFFPQRALLSTITGWQSQVRLRVLEAIGRCNTLQYLDVQDIFSGDISRLTANEWKVLLRGFSCSTHLRVIRVERLTWTSLAEVESLCLQLGGILRTSSVTDMTIGNCRLSDRCFLNLASRLGGDYQSKLKTLELCNAWKDSSAMKHMADMIKSATRLETLEIGGSWERMYDMDEEAARILSQALIQSSSLRKLVLREVKGEASAFLLKAFSKKALDGDGGNQAIQCLHLISVFGLGDSLRELLSSNSYLEEVTLAAIDMRPEEWSRLGQAIRETATAKSIRVTHFMRQKDDLKGVEELVCAASSDDKDPKVELIITFYDYDALISALNFVGEVLRGEIRSLESLILYFNCSCPPGSNENRMPSIVPMDENLRDTTVLKRLKLFFKKKDTLKGVWKYLLVCLRNNTSLTQLDLSDSELDDEAFRDLMGLLQKNLTLRAIEVSGTSWQTDGKAALIQQALEQNRKRAEYMAVFREARLAFGDAKVGRLFLCGSPRAGKTQLRQTLMRIVQVKLKDKVARLFRTTGIEVEFLQNNEKRQISIWDLAGQEIFRTLQNVLFPPTSSFCVFLFVYSPFCDKTSSIKPASCLQIELEEWLSFITSCTRVTGDNLPQVLVVISHKDKMQSIPLTWAQPIVENLSKQFANFVDVHPIQERFHINARKKKQVVPLKNHIFQIFEKLLSERSPQVPKLCFQLSFDLVTNTKNHSSCPLWTSQQFHEFCTPRLRKLIPSSPPLFVERIISSIKSYLNDVGSIVHIPNLDYIIVNPNWLTNTLLGELIAFGQNFQAQDSESSDRWSSYTSKDGFVSESVFARLIEEFLEKQPHEQRSVDREVLENILINLDLCFKLEDTSQYFIPSFIPEHASMEEESAVQSMAWKTWNETSEFAGMRIQCQDARTMSMTTAFFPCFQMFMRRKLISEMGFSKETVTCSRYSLHLFLDGHEIYVEQDKSHKYVDVLMLCSSHQPRERATKYVTKHIVQELISFCASSKGCPGVALVLGVIQTHCVEMLIPSNLRRAILIEELKSDFIRSINDKLGEISLIMLHLNMINDWKKEELLNYKHCWPSIGRDIGRRSERARDLLWESDVEAVVNEILQNRIQQLESLQEGLITVDYDLAECYFEGENMISCSNAPQMKDLEPLSSRCLRRSNTSEENRSILKRLNFEYEPLRRHFMSTLQGVDMKIQHILSVQQELHSTLSLFMFKVDRIIGYPQAFQQARTPKRPYVTDDVGILYKLSAGLHVGRIVRLHLMCESVTGFHTVEDQEGLKIRLDLEKWGWIQKTIEISYKVIYYAAKARLNGTLGIVQAIPALADLESDIVKLDGISREDRKAVLKGGESKELNEAWLRIQQILAPELQNSYSYCKIFKLYQVKYVSLEKGGHAWVCEECMNKGLRSGSLT
ncbi:hypothetical protein MPTK1_8g04761 [Marchantia polymorpha subsp. ruderalis]